MEKEALGSFLVSWGAPVCFGLLASLVSWQNGGTGEPFPCFDDLILHER